MECNVIKTNSFISFGNQFMYYSLLGMPKLGWVDILAYIYFVLVLLRLEQIPLPLMYGWYWILFFSAGCFCSALTPRDRVPGLLQFKMKASFQNRRWD